MINNPRAPGKGHKEATKVDSKNENKNSPPSIGITFTNEVRFRSVYQAAMYWISKGYEVIPIKPYGNTPTTPHGLNDSTSDINQIRAWFSNEPIYGVPHLNIATVPKEGSPLFDVDIDMHNSNGYEEWRKLTKGKKVPRTLTELTQSGGLHLSFMGESPIKSKVGIVDGIDIIGQKHYLIRAPSVRNRGAYHLFDGEIANAPAWLLEFIEPDTNTKESMSKTATRYSGTSNVMAEEIVASLESYWGKAPSGHSFRANMAMALAGFLLRKNVSVDDVKWIIAELGRRTGHADHSRVVDYTLNKLVSGSDRVTGATTLDKIVREVDSCLK